jgi:hypothetical protein
MPAPGYIICSESGAQDLSTNKASVFNVLESMQIAALPPGQMAPAATVRLVCTWIREDGDTDETRFQAEAVLHFPNAAQERVVNPTPIEFAFAGPLQRLTFQGIPITEFHGPGMLYIEVRLRRIGEADWLARHRFPIILQEMPVPPQVASAAPPTT